MSILEERINSVYQSLTRQEKIAADYCLKNESLIYNATVSELAEQSGTTQATWSRFSKSLGYDGLKGLKKDLFTEAKKAEKAGPRIEFKDVNEYTSLQAIADNICATSCQAVQTTYRLFDAATFGEAVASIIAADQIQIFGVGNGHLAAYDLYCKLLRLSYHAVFNNDPHNCLMTASQAGEDDVAIFLCDSGRTDSILKLVSIVKERGASTIAITKLGNSPLAQTCDHVLFTTSPEIDKKSGVTSSRFSQLYLVDTLYTAIANRDYDNIKQYLQSSYDVFRNMGAY